MRRSRPHVLVMLDYFLPGEKAGGPVRTVAALVSRLEDFQFQIVTRDRDLGDPRPYDDVVTGTWTCHRGIPSFYLESSQLGPRVIGRLLRSVPHDVLYLNGLFSVPLTLWPLALRRARLVPRPPVVVAPRVQLNPGALGLKARKKRWFLRAVRLLGLFRGVHWQATNAVEVEYLRRWFGADVPVTVAPNLRTTARSPIRRGASDGPLRVVFISRISRMKNLDGAVKILQDVRAPLRFQVYGPLEDPVYWQHCVELMDRLPPNVSASYEGTLRFERVHDVFAEADVLLLPTLGENFGHVIMEALSAGCLALISDRTPWQGLRDVGVGWDLPLDDPQAFRAALEELASASPAERAERAESAVRWARDRDEDPTAERLSAQLLRDAAAARR